MVYEIVSGSTVDGRIKGPTSPENSDGLHCRGVDTMKVELFLTAADIVDEFLAEGYKKTWIRFKRMILQAST